MTPKELRRQKNRESRRKLRQHRKEKGLCTECGQHNDRIEVGGSTCHKCNNKRKEREKIRYHQKKTKGLCVECGTKLQHNETARCNQCNKRIAQYMSIMREKRLSKSLCVYCGESEIYKYSKTMCKPCLKRHNKYQLEWAIDRINQNICPRCGKEMFYKYTWTCEECGIKSKRIVDKLRKERLYSGKCIRCENPKLKKGKTHCIKCVNKYLKYIKNYRENK